MKKQESFSEVNDEQRALRIATLIAGYIKGTLSRAEHHELDGWVTLSMSNQRLFEELTDPNNSVQWNKSNDEATTERSLKKLKERIDENKQKSNTSSSRFRTIGISAAVAAATTFIALIALYMLSPKREHPIYNSLSAKNDAVPGKAQATVTFGDGSTKALDSIGSGQIGSQGGSKVVQGKNGQLSYLPDTSATSALTVYNTLKVPRGGEFQLVLSDGTLVKLNADSWIRYPTAFNKDTREVEVGGEAYFDIARNFTKPFFVSAGNVKIAVLGTAFNINTYPEKSVIQITLAKGTVEVCPISSSHKQQLLSPGQQAEVSRLDGSLKISEVNLGTALAWKNGLFTFQNTPLEDVLAQITRWYDINAVDSTSGSNHFNASIPRNVPLSKLLHMLEQTKQVHFHTESNRIIVTN